MNSAREWHVLLEALRDGAAGALVTLLRTRGSTFRRAGSRMLVHPDGRVLCELSGGCPQRDLVLRSQAAMLEGAPLTVAYNADSGMDVLLEMGCGGEMDVLIEPLAQPSVAAFVEPLLACIRNRRPVWLATWFGCDGRVRPARRLILDVDGVVFDQFEDAALMRSVAAVVQGGNIRRAVTMNMPANGVEADVLIEPVTPPHRLAIIGNNAAASAFAPVIEPLGWQLTLVDADPNRLQPENLPPNVSTVCASPAQLHERLPLDANSSVLVMTHNVELDIAWLAALRDSPAAYIGALGSRERAARMRGQGGYADDAVLHAPAGLDIGSETPAEIALSVVAEILMKLNGRHGGPLYAAQGAIHGN